MTGEVKVLMAGISLLEHKDLEVYTALHGKTGCMVVEIAENDEVVYSAKAFVGNEKELEQIANDLKKIGEWKSGQA